MPAVDALYHHNKILYIARGEILLSSEARQIILQPDELSKIRVVGLKSLEIHFWQRQTRRRLNNQHQIDDIPFPLKLFRQRDEVIVIADRTLHKIVHSEYGGMLKHEGISRYFPWNANCWAYERLTEVCRRINRYASGGGGWSLAL